MASRLIGALALCGIAFACSQAWAGSPPQSWSGQGGTATLYDGTGKLISSTNPLPVTTSGGGGGGAVYGPTAVGSPAANPPIVTGGTATGGATGNVQAIKVDTSGNQFENLAQVGGSAVALGSTTSSASVPVVIASDQAAVAVKNATASALQAQVQGTAAAASAASGNPVQAGCVYTASFTTLTPGVVNPCALDVNGNLRASMFVQGIGYSAGVAATRGMVSTQSAGSSIPLAVTGYGYNGSTQDPITDIVGGVASGVGTQSVHVAPTTVAAGATLNTNCTVACSTTPTVPAGSHNLYNIVASSTAAGWLLIFDATVCPADGTVTPVRAYAMPTLGTSMAISFAGEPLHFSTGIASCFSTTGPYTKTASTTAFIGMGYE